MTSSKLKWGRKECTHPLPLLEVKTCTHLAHFAATSPTPPVDKRGKQPNLQAKGEDIKQQIHGNILSFPTTESHYGRAKGTKGRKFLSSSLSVAAIHELYLQKCELDAAELRYTHMISCVHSLLPV